MKKLTVLILLLLTLSQNSLWAQSSREEQIQMQKQVEEIMKARDEMLKSLMDDSFSGEFEKRMEDMMKRFGGSAFGNGGNGFGFDQVNSISIGSYDWDETDTHKILKIKVTQSKDKPLDIKIENGMISLKGVAESVSGTGKNKVTSHMNFQKSFSLPTDIDQNNPEFINKDKEGEMWIKFKRIAGKNVIKSGGKTKAVKPQIQNQTPDDERTPIKASEGDISI